MTLPTREEVKEAWRPFNQKYPEYLATANRDNWLMQDNIVYAFMEGELQTREEWAATIDYEAARLMSSALINDVPVTAAELDMIVPLIVDAALGDNESAVDVVSRIGVEQEAMESTE